MHVIALSADLLALLNALVREIPLGISGGEIYIYIFICIYTQSSFHTRVSHSSKCIHSSSTGKEFFCPLSTLTPTHIGSGGATSFGFHTFGDQQVRARKVIFWVLSIEIRKELPRAELPGMSLDLK